MPSMANVLAQNVPLIVINAVSAANTAAATSAAIDLQGYDGVVQFIQQTGAVTGTLDGKIQDCDTSGGTYADLPGTPNPGLIGAQVTAANKIQTVSLDTRSVRRFVKYVGTVVTGPVLISVVMIGNKKYRP